jgi:hypothetical protein
MNVGSVFLLPGVHTVLFTMFSVYFLFVFRSGKFYLSSFEYSVSTPLLYPLCLSSTMDIIHISCLFNFDDCNFQFYNLFFCFYCCSFGYLFFFLIWTDTWCFNSYMHLTMVISGFSIPSPETFIISLRWEHLIDCFELFWIHSTLFLNITLLWNRLWKLISPYLITTLSLFTMLQLIISSWFLSIAPNFCWHFYLFHFF